MALDRVAEADQKQVVRETDRLIPQGQQSVTLGFGSRDCDLLEVGILVAGWAVGFTIVQDPFAPLAHGVG